MAHGARRRAVPCSFAVYDRIRVAKNRDREILGLQSRLVKKAAGTITEEENRSDNVRIGASRSY